MPSYMPDNPQYFLSTVTENSVFNIPFKSKDLLSKVVSDRISFLYDTITEMNRYLLQRTRLRNDFQQEISKDHVQIQNLLFEQQNKGQDISSLELRLVELSKEERQQELSHWRDTVELNQKRRYTEKELRRALLDLWLLKLL